MTLGTCSKNSLRMDILSGSTTDFLDIKNKLGDLVQILAVIPLLLCLIFMLYCVLYSVMTETFSEMPTILLTMTYVGKGKHLCAVCKRASASRGFTEERHLNYMRISSKAFTNIKFFNSFGKDNDDVRFKAEYVNGIQCFTIHDCGCLQNIQYELMSYHPMRLVCQPSSDYENVFVEGNMEGVLDPVQFKIIEQVPDENPEMRSIDKCLEGENYRDPVKIHYTKGNIIFGENSYVNSKSSFLVGKETAKLK